MYADALAAAGWIEVVEVTLESGSRADIAIVGSYPPPYGGVSVHIKNLLPYLDDAGLDYVVYNTGPVDVERSRVVNVGRTGRGLIRVLSNGSHKVVHLHTSKWQVRFLGACICGGRACDLVMTAHGASLPKSLGRLHPFRRLLSRWSVKRSRLIVATNEYIKKALIDAGFSDDKSVVVPAFIPPPDRGVIDDVPDVVRSFCANRSPVIAANGGYVLIDGEDVYGLSCLADLADALLPQFPNLAIVVYMRVGADAHRAEFASLLDRLNGTRLRSHVLFYDSTGDFYPFLNMCDLLVRPTSTDGDANSIREALYYGVPVVASDVIWRPDGCLTYRFGDDAELACVVGDALGNIDCERERVSNIRHYNAGEVLVELYRELLGAKTVD